MNIKSNSSMNNVMSRMNIEIIDSGYVKTDTTWHGENICSPYSRLYFVEYGKGILQYDNQEFIMHPEFVYLIPTGILYNYWCKNTIHKLYFHINIIKPNGYDLLLDCKEFGKHPISLDKIRTMKNLYYSNNYIDALFLKQEIFSSISSILKEINFNTDTSMRYSSFIQDTISYINDNLSLQLNINTLAKRLFISPSTLAKHFKNEVGITISKYIDDLIFFSAERMLLKSDLSIGEISEMLGFCDQFYFSRRFSQKYGETPRQYRNRLKLTDIT